MQAREQLVNWLKDAYSMEKALVPVLENHAKDAKNHPQIEARIRQHVDETNRHADLVRGCIERLGGDVSTIKTGLASMFGTLKEVPMAVSSDEIVKNALADYSTEHFEIASYKALIATAQHVGDMETARICQEILRDEEEMQRWLDQQLPMVVQIFLGQQTREAGA
ncbi:MAG TPA: ferritin-like domain-containing protein [Herpetosiphonaceae bacterium]